METRGERNNNPLNIDRTGILWVGMSEIQIDPRFITWTSPEYCYRAAARIIRLHYATGRMTVEAIINAWAPPAENQTSAYVMDVLEHMIKRFGTLPADGQGNHPLVINNRTGDPSQLLALLAAMTYHENGEDIYPDQTIQVGMDLNASGAGEP